MDKKTALEIAGRFIKSLPERYAAKQAFLFGSYAKETAHEYSDIDIALVLQRYSNAYDVRVALMKLSRKIDLRIEPHPIKEKEFNYSNPLASEILKYGIPLNVK
ncbi:MAG: nucleotidyltransferase domain-containing protein [Cyclobacteriaceae bacterium]